MKYLIDDRFVSGLQATFERILEGKRVHDETSIIGHAATSEIRSKLIHQPELTKEAKSCEGHILDLYHWVRVVRSKL